MDNYLLTNHKEDIQQILLDPSETKHFSININFLVLFESCPDLANKLLKEPDETIEEWDIILKKTQNTLLLQLKDYENIMFKNNTHCRIYELPACPELHRKKFPENEDADKFKFLQISGTVVRISATKLLEYQRPYVCAVCKHPVIVKSKYDRRNIIVAPKKCRNPQGCKSTNIIVLDDLNSDNCKDYQEIKIQERVSKLSVGSVPNSMWVTLEDDLVDICKPGDNITICGTVKRRWGRLSLNKRIDIELALKANHIQISNSTSCITGVTPENKEMFVSFWENYADRPLVGRNLILKSFCPQLYGLYLVKLAVAVVLAGGVHVPRDSSTKTRIRSDPHILLVGDPGTGKSELLRYASKIIPRSVLTTGVGSTAAGLTVTALMENGEWLLEGGALVLADGGICCIDEFNSMKEHDRTSIHEAMEQQSISVAKAGIVCTLNTRCSILAATNPKGNIDSSQPLNMNIALSSPLLSRFDLILLLKDTINNEWDSLVADYILSGKRQYSKLLNKVTWSLEMLQAYFGTIKKINPVLTAEAECVLEKYYHIKRRNNNQNQSRTTMRLLQSLIRLSQGHARLMFHNEVKVIDAITAIILIETAVDRESSIFNIHVEVQGDFPQNPMENYHQTVQIILNKLQLPDILDRELSRLNFSDNNKVESRFFQNNAAFINNLDNIESITEQSEEVSLIIESINNVQTDHDLNNSTKKKPETVSNKRRDESKVQNLDDIRSISARSEEINQIINSINDVQADHGPNNSTKKAFKMYKKKPETVTSNRKDTNIENITAQSEEISQIINSSINDVQVDCDPNNSTKKAFKICRKTVTNKKRDNNSPPSKKIKVKEIQNDLQMLNFMPSVNDEFNLNMLEFDDEIPASTSQIVVECNQTINSKNTKPKISLKEKFGFKPKVSDEINCVQNEISNDDNAAAHKSKYVRKKSIFDSQKDEIDSLDLEF